MDDFRRCSKCGAIVENEAEVCADCGEDLSGSIIKPLQLVQKTGAIYMAVSLALGTAVVCAAIWGGIAIATNMEIGWIAWGIGIAVGSAIVMKTDERSVRLGGIAVLLAILSILGGKLFYMHYGVQGSYEKEILTNESLLFNIFWIDQEERGKLDKRFVDWMTEHADDSEIAFKKATPETQNFIVSTNKKMDKKYKSLTKEEKIRLSKIGAKKMLANVSYIDMIKATMSFWDILWFILAISSAWKIATNYKENTI